MVGMAGTLLGLLPLLGTPIHKDLPFLMLGQLLEHHWTFSAKFWKKLHDLQHQLKNKYQER
ncbi:hypothetical protein Pyn_35942 [Prunus yedoensis var. nudiflora]|uniref:Uncharacterized protein n=1 Tax=Prunus yedoensis var. nudiflora TaxID=2094558 RepID=A0A314YT56_PRUYE|nr:hypothetical protein Pyn_35942 [Prunus yedoensis var. nudiflora]